MPANTLFEACFPASSSGLGIALREVETFCVTRALPRDLVSRVLVIVEEVFTNTVKYGYGGDSNRPVKLRLSAEEVLTLVFEDEAAPFDPTRDAPPSTVMPDEAPEGRSGIAIVIGLSASIHYVRLPNGNLLTLTL